MVQVPGFEPATLASRTGHSPRRPLNLLRFSSSCSRYSAGRMRDVEQISRVCSYFRTTNPRTIFEDEK
jgi:hypothetical protein